jgi:hypothetical protein
MGKPAAQGGGAGGGNNIHDLGHFETSIKNADEDH